MSLLASRRNVLIPGLLSILLLLQPLAGPAQPESPAKAPRLIVVVVIDQFRADYLVRFRDRFGAGGFNRLLREGAQFTSCFYPYAKTNTAPGHATLATGTTPDRHGIANNRWYDFERGRTVAAVFDEAAPLVGSRSDGRGASPRNLLGSTLADQLRLATEGKAKVFGVALKDRAAIFSTGHTASGAYWYGERGRFITSRYYREELPDWVQAFNQRRPADRYYGKDWKVGDKVFLSLTTESGKPDPAFYHQQFPFTPYANDIVIEFAQELVVQEELGQDEITDFLFIGFSANDMAGHRWGPYNDEVADMTLRTDAQLAALLRFLDKRIGTGKYWLALSADHGVAPTLAQARARGIPAKNVDARALLAAVQKALADEWGDDEWLLPRAGLINRETLHKHGLGVAQAAHVAGGALLNVDGVLGYVAGEETRLDAATTKAVRRSTYRGRVPDVQVVLEPFALLDAERGGTTHGSPYTYDQHVPLIFFGPAFRPGVYPEKVSPLDLAATLAAALRITPPARATGQVLTQALRMK